MLNLEQQIFKQLEKYNNILITFPSDGNGDAIASALALWLFLRGMDKKADLVGLKPETDRYSLSFLPGYQSIENSLSNLRRFIVSLDIRQAKVSQIKYTVDNGRLNFIISPADGWFKPEDVSTRAGEFKYDLIITCGVTDLESLGKLYDDNVEFFYKVPVINIDHHGANDEFGQVNLIDLNAVATAEIIFYLLKNYKPELINEDIATCLLAGIIQQTKNFKTPNITPRTLLTTSQLIDLGARREEIINHLYRSRNLTSLRLWGKILNNLQSEDKNTLLWSKLTTADLKDAGDIDNDLADIIDELIINVPSAKIAVIFCASDNEKTNVIVYSLKNINTLEFTKEYASAGSVKIARFTIHKEINAAIPEIIANFKNKLDKLVS